MSRSVRAFKKGLDGEVARQKREAAVISLRKSLRDDRFAKRRAQMKDEPLGSDIPPQVVASETSSMPRSTHPRLSELPLLIPGIHSDVTERQLECVCILRKMLANEQFPPPIQEVVESGAVRRLAHMLTFEGQTRIQLEAAWALTNIASGTSEQTRSVVDADVIPSFVRLLRSPSEELRDQATWGLGNIAGDSPEYRDLILQAGALSPLVGLCGPHSSLSVIRNAVWTLSNLCRGKPQPDFRIICSCIPKLVELLSIPDEEALADVGWALSFISDEKLHENVKMQALLDADIAVPLIKLLSHKSERVRTPVLRTVGNLATGSDKQTQTLLEAGLLRHLIPLLSDARKSIRKEACWTVSNIAAGPAEQIEAVLEAGIARMLAGLVSGADWEVQKEAAWALVNATSGGTSGQIHQLVTEGIIEALVHLLLCHDPRMVLVCLEGLNNILREGKVRAERLSTRNMYCETVEESGGLEALEALQKHENEEIYNKAVKLLEDYFEAAAEVGAVDSLVPPVSGRGIFAFPSTGTPSFSLFTPSPESSPSFSSAFTTSALPVSSQSQWPVGLSPTPTVSLPSSLGMSTLPSPFASDF